MISNQQPGRFELLHRARLYYARGVSRVWACAGAAVFAWAWGDYRVGLVAAAIHLLSQAVFCWKLFGPENRDGLFQCAKSLDMLVAAERKDARMKESVRVVFPPDPQAN